MSLVNSIYQPGFEQLYDPVALQQTTIHKMSAVTSPYLFQTSRYTRSNTYTHEHPRFQSKHTRSPGHSTFVKRCSQLAHGRRRSVESRMSAARAPTIAQWVQRLPSNPSANEEFLESVLEQAVGKLVCGPNLAAEEIELGYNYDLLEDAVPGALVRVQAKTVEADGKTWIQASITSKAEPYERPETYAYGRWQLVSTDRRSHH